MVSNRCPNFKSGTKLHFSVGGTSDAYGSLASRFCQKWLCLCSDGFDSDSLESEFNEKLQVIFVKNENYSRYYYKYISECLYPALLGYPNNAISCDKYKDYLYVMKIVLEELRKFSSNDVLLCDYHLYKLPALIDWDCQKIFFWFIPFLCTEFHTSIYKEIVEDLSKCDKIFFLTVDYAENFKKSFKYYFPHKRMESDIEVMVLGPNKDFEYTEHISQKDFKECLRQFKIEYSDQENYLLNVSRLDFVKNIPLTMQGFEHFIEKYPDSNSRLLIIAPHHRKDSEVYQHEEKIISNVFSHLSCRNRIHLVHQRFSREELMTLYKFSDMLISASRFDGMPLTPFEYALANNGRGSIVTSNTSGTYTFVGEYAYSFRSEDPVSLGQVIANALYDSQDIRKSRLSTIKTLVKNITVDHWADEVAKVLSNGK